MTRRQWIGFFVLASLWGASYLFIKVALEDVSPAVVVFARTALAAAVLAPFALSSGALGGLREQAGPIAVLAALQVAAPFMLISEGEQHISSSLTGILVATAPIFTFLLAVKIDAEQRLNRTGLLGVALGIVGVITLLGPDAGGGLATLGGGAMVVTASMGYALGAFWLKRRVRGEPIAIVTASMATSAVMVLPFVALAPPAALPGLDTVGSLTALGVLGTGVSFVIYHTLIAEIGPARASVVAYVATAFAVVYGVVLLDEDFSAATLAGMVLVLSGSWLAAEGRLPWRSHKAPFPAVVGT